MGREEYLESILVYYIFHQGFKSCHFNLAELWLITEFGTWNVVLLGFKNKQHIKTEQITFWSWTGQFLPFFSRSCGRAESFSEHWCPRRVSSLTCSLLCFCCSSSSERQRPSSDSSSVTALTFSETPAVCKLTRSVCVY